MIRLETPRLILRDWEDKDLDPMYALNQDPKVMEYFPTLPDWLTTQRFIVGNQQQMQQHGFSFYAIELKATHEFIGFVGLNNVDFIPTLSATVEIGWRLSAAHWGNGYATEAAKRVIKHAFEDLHLNEVVAFTVPNNLRSRRVMEKVGLLPAPEHDFGHPKVAEGHPLRQHVLYCITKKEYSDNSTIIS